MVPAFAGKTICWEDTAMVGNFTICVGTVGSGAWLSPDGGESWRRVGKGLGNESRIFGLTVHPREPRTVFAGANDGIYKSGDGGQSFERLQSPMDNLDVWRIAIDPTDPDIIFAGTRPAALFRSKDGGARRRSDPALARRWAELADAVPPGGAQFPDLELRDARGRPRSHRRVQPLRRTLRQRQRRRFLEKAAPRIHRDPRRRLGAKLA